jgi:C6 transcription factor Pro1
VPVLREKIKSFLASQGMIKGHSGPGPRNSDQQPQILVLCDRSEPPSPPTPTLSATSSSEGHRSPALHATSYVRDASDYSSLSIDPPPPYNTTSSESKIRSNMVSFSTYNPGLHPSSMQELHHHHHQQHPSSFVSSRGPSFPNDIMLHPYGPTASNPLPSPNSIVPMCPPTSCKNPYRY